MTRREFFRDAAAAAAMPLVGGCAGLSGWGARHRSDYGGVQIGAITYSFRTMPMSRDCTVSHALGAGLGTIELMGCDFEREAGAPHSLKFGQWNLTKEQQHDLLEWRRTVDMGVVRELRRRYDDAGVGVHIVKFGGIGHMSPWETDYCFRVAQALGAGAITRELPDPKDNFAGFEKNVRRLAPYMDKYGVKIAFHNHTQINATTYDGALLGMNENLMINFDMGHYVAANDDDPLEFVKKYRDRIFSIHLKDRTRKANGARNLAFGSGDTPLAGLFALLQREGWDIPCDVELEYAIPKGSDPVREVGVCNAYCRARCVDQQNKENKEQYA